MTINRIFSPCTLLLLFCLSASTLSAQHLEVGILGGASNYLGDLSNNSRSIYMKETNLAGGLFLRYNLHELATIRLGANYTTISGADQNNTDANLSARNLSFSSNVIDIALIGEFNILGYQPYNLYRPFSPYLFVGFGLFTYDPTTIYEGETVKLRPLGTEGQGNTGRPEPYGKTAFSIPFGFGLKYALSDKINLGLELGARRTTTDYLDDVSTIFVDPAELGDPATIALSNRSGEIPGSDPAQFSPGMPRGDDKARDWFFIAGLTVSYNFIDNGLVGSRARRNRGKKGCRTE
jgi:opacity protein-like surface antigen